MPGTGQISHINIFWFSMIVNIILWGGGVALLVRQNRRCHSWIRENLMGVILVSFFDVLN